MTDVPAPATDTPIAAPPGAVDTLKAFIGDLARPFALYAVALATAKVICGGAPADVIGAAGLVLGALYGAKVVENIQQGKHDAQVAVAQANAGAPGAAGR
jgi:hypothetical protein